MPPSRYGRYRCRVDARRWIGQLGLPTQARLLEARLPAVERDPRWEWLELGCSVADGRGDDLSDLDVGLGFDDANPPAEQEVTDLLRGLGPVVEVAFQPWDGMRRWWVQ